MYKRIIFSKNIPVNREPEKATVVYFGCIDRKYSRNKTNIDGLRQNGAVVHEIIVDTPVTPLNTKSHLGVFRLAKRLFRKLLIIPLVIKKRNLIRESDFIFVGYPGQFDIPLAYITARIFRKKLVFDPVILMFNALSNDIGVIPKHGIITGLLKKFESIVIGLPDMVIASSIQQKQFFCRKSEYKSGKSRPRLSCG